MKNIKFGPLGLYILWIGICLIFGALIPVLSANSDSSAQAPFMLGIYAVIPLVLGLFVISLLKLFLFKDLIKKFKYINGVIAIITGFIIVYFIIKILTL
jgi:threonine/homoserine/homoserine lactone efflux protein